MTDTPWLTVKEAAIRARCGAKTIYAAIERHQLRAVTAKGKAFRIHVTWLDAWLDAAAVPVSDGPGPALLYQPRREQ